jgi:hypothetical protein
VFICVHLWFQLSKTHSSDRLDNLMQITLKRHHHFYWQLLLLIAASFPGLIPGVIGVAQAQETVETANPASESSIAQSEASQPTQRRLRNPFFEQGKKLKFGSGEFLQSALDGANNFFAADSITNVSRPNVDLNAPPIPGAHNIPGTLTVSGSDRKNPNFLTTLTATFVSTTPGVKLTFSSASYGSDPRMGTLTVDGTISVHGQTITLHNVPANYSGSYSINNNRVSGVAQVVDPSNPGNTIVLQLPPTTVPDIDGPNFSIPRPAVFSIGLPSDR